MLWFTHGTGGDADDRQGNGACLGYEAGLFFRYYRFSVSGILSGFGLPGLPPFF